MHTTHLWTYGVSTALPTIVFATDVSLTATEGWTLHWQPNVSYCFMLLWLEGTSATNSISGCDIARGGWVTKGRHLQEVIFSRCAVNNSRAPLLVALHYLLLDWWLKTGIRDGANRSHEDLSKQYTNNPNLHVYTKSQPGSRQCTDNSCQQCTQLCVPLKSETWLTLLDTQKHPFPNTVFPLFQLICGARASPLPVFVSVRRQRLSSSYVSEFKRIRYVVEYCTGMEGVVIPYVTLTLGENGPWEIPKPIYFTRSRVIRRRYVYIRLYPSHEQVVLLFNGHFIFSCYTLWVVWSLHQLL